MIEILPVVDFKTVQKMIAERGIECAQPIFLLASEQGETVGGAAVMLTGCESGSAELVDAWTQQEGDMPLFDGIVRAAASFLYERGKKQVVCRREPLYKRLTAVGFHENNGILMAELPQFFQKCRK